jgi:hypothetical protein
MPRPNKRKKQLVIQRDVIAKRRKTTKDERLKVPKEDLSPVDAIVAPETQRRRSHALKSLFPQQQTKLLERLLHLTFRKVFLLLTHRTVVEADARSSSHQLKRARHGQMMQTMQMLMMAICQALPLLLTLP